MKLNSPERIRALKKVLTNDNITTDVKRMYLIAFVECGSLNEIQEVSKSDEDFKSLRQQVDDLPNSINTKIMDFSDKEWNDVSLDTLRDLSEKVHNSIK